MKTNMRSGGIFNDKFIANEFVTEIISKTSEHFIIIVPTVQQLVF